MVKNSLREEMTPSPSYQKLQKIEDLQNWDSIVLM